MIKIPRYMSEGSNEEYEHGLQESILHGQTTVNPLALVLILTTECNTNCCYCPYRKASVVMERKSIDMSVALRAIKEFSALGGRYVRFSGGEPFLYPGLAELVDQASEMGLHTTVVTNGLALRTESIPWLSQLQALTISIDTLDPVVAPRIRGIAAGTYEAILTALERHRAKAPTTWIGVNCVISRNNVGSIPNLVRELTRRGIPIQFQPCHSFGKEENAGEYPLPGDITKLVAQLMDMFDQGYLINNSKWYLERMSDYINGDRKPENCSVVHCQVIVDTDAHVRLCCMMPPVGSVMDASISSILQSKRTVSQKAAVSEGHCPQCWLMYMDIDV